ncbi:MAG TPA: ATP-dependent helicase [Pyrinomonadaceae bacterium]|nr:ATP-dependent helicase [Pyrinomonadaceae bacterium]
MAITQAQKDQAALAQTAAAVDPSPRIRLIAGPGTGKSAVIERRVAHLLRNGIDGQYVHVVSFTRASRKELVDRIAAHCANEGFGQEVQSVRVSTMHSLALRILKSASVLSTLYPGDPAVLDKWERAEIYDSELSGALGCTPTRAREIRTAYDAQWQTLNPQTIAQAAITPAEMQGFNGFHSTRRNLYSCVLPGEVIHECVARLNAGHILPNQLPRIDHLIVDEYQDLNSCDQEFIRLLADNGASLFVAGDDDQSIYSFRHANPNGIVNFQATYPLAKTHILTDCFRCTPAIVVPANTLIAHNAPRVPKVLQSLYANSAPPVQGSMKVWAFQTATEEAAAIAQSCGQLIVSGIAGQEDQIVILISNRKLQLEMITQALTNAGLPYDAPMVDALRDLPALRAIYSILRILSDQTAASSDYPAYRGLLSLLHGVGTATCKAVGDQCVANNQNYRELFSLTSPPQWLSSRAASCVGRIQSIVQQLVGWSLQDTIGNRLVAITQMLSSTVFTAGPQVQAILQQWNSFVS